MDLWDLTKLLARRWYIAAPMLLASVVVVFFLNKSIPPDYSATGHLQLIPAHTATTTVSPNRVKNPWVELGVGALGDAATVKVTDPAVLDDLVAQGYTDNFEVAMSGTILVVTATGDSPAKASGTVNQVMALITADIKDEQVRYGVVTDDLITTLPLDNGQRVTVTSSKAKRTVAAAGAVGVLVTIGATIGIDVLLRRRARRLAGPAALSIGAADGPPTDPYRNVGRSADRSSGPTVASPYVGLRNNGRSGSTAPTETMPRATGQPPSQFDVRDVPPPTTPVDATGETPIAVEVEYPRRGATDTDIDVADRLIDELNPVDSTIILPLTHAPSRDDRTKKR